MASPLLGKRWLYRLSAAVVFLLALRLFADWQHIKAPTYTLSTGSYAGEPSESLKYLRISLTSFSGKDVGKPAPASVPLTATTPVTATITVASESVAAPSATSAQENENLTEDETHDETVDNLAQSNPINASTITDDLQQKVTKYVNAIFDPNDTSTDRLSCPEFNADRYAHLQVPAGEHRKKYFFALNLRQCADLLPRLMGSIVEAMQFLGPQNTVLSIVEGNSDDGTLEILSEMKTELADLGVRYYLRRDGLNPLGGEDRIGNLALLRSMAVEPLRNSRDEFALSLELPGADLSFDDDAVVIFLNDVSACPEDIRTYFPFVIDYIDRAYHPNL